MKRMRWMSDAGAENGSALLELSLILPLVTLLFVGVVDLGFAIDESIVVSSAAEVGARYGTVPSKSNDLSGMQSAASAAAPGIPGFLAVATNWCSCTPAGAVVSCTSTCAASAPLIRYVQVQTSAIVPALAGYPGLPASFALKGFSALRVQ